MSINPRKRRILIGVSIGLFITSALISQYGLPEPFSTVAKYVMLRVASSNYQRMISDLRLKVIKSGYVSIIISLTPIGDLRALDDYSTAERDRLIARRLELTLQLKSFGGQVQAKESSLQWSTPGFAATVDLQAFDFLTSQLDVSIVEDFEVKLT